MEDAMTDVMMKYTGQTKAEDMKEELKIVQALHSSPSTKGWVKSAAMRFLVAEIWLL